MPDREPGLFDGPGLPVVRRLTNQQRLALRRFAEAAGKGLTDRALSASMRGSALRSRRAELLAMGLLKDSGTHRTEGDEVRVVWIITSAGHSRFMSEVNAGNYS